MSIQSQLITTAHELLNAHTSIGRCELVRGELVMMNPAKGRHAAVAMRIGSRLMSFVRAAGLGEVFDSSAGYVLARNPDTLREPGVSFMGRERLQKQDLDAFLEGAPDLAVEVLSPGNTTAEMDGKLLDYFAAGCHVVWIVDPANRTIAVYRSLAEKTVLGELDSLTEPFLLPGFSLDVSDVFPAP